MPALLLCLFGCSDTVERYGGCEQIAASQLSVFSNNVGIFPQYLVDLYSDSLKEKKQDLVADEAERAELYAAALLNFEQDPDVILLQEIWSTIARDVLIDELAVEYPYFAHPEAPSDQLQPAGLIVFSKYALEDFDYHVFTKGEGVDLVSQKGIVGVRLVKDAAAVGAFVTHLQAGGSDKTIRPDQMRESSEFIRGFGEAEVDMVKFLVGDLNTNSNGDAYQDIFDNLPGATDSYVGDCSELKKTARYDDDPTKRIDYLLVFDGVDAVSGIVDPGGKTLADHLAVSGIVAL